MIVISDTSVFTTLAAIGHLHLLQQLYNRIFIPTAVYQELTVDPPSRQIRSDCSSALEINALRNKKSIQKEVKSNE